MSRPTKREYRLNFLNTTSNVRTSRRELDVSLLFKLSTACLADLFVTSLFPVARANGIST